MAKNPKWTREEEIIALDYYFRIYHEGGNASELIEEASRLLRIMPNCKNASDAETFRNVNGVSMRMGNFMSLDPTYEGQGLTSVGRQTIAVWEEFEGNRTELSQEAELLRKKTWSARCRISSPKWMPVLLLSLEQLFSH